MVTRDMVVELSIDGIKDKIISLKLMLSDKDLWKS